MTLEDGEGSASRPGRS